MDNFFLTLFLLLVILSFYSILIQPTKSQPHSKNKTPFKQLDSSSTPSTSLSQSSDLSGQVDISESNFPTSQPPQSSSFSSLTPTITSQSHYSSLDQKIKSWGESNSLNNISPILNYLTHSDSLVRISVAEALGKLVKGKKIRTQMRQAIQCLGRLSRDPDVSVRLSAVEALGKIKSPLVIDYLKLAQKDTNSRVIQSASAALNSFKKSSLSSQKKVSNQPKNVFKQLLVIKTHQS